MLIHRPDRPPIVLDYRETAPAAASREAYLSQQGRPIPGKTKYGAWAVGVPGTVRGLLHALEHHGSGRVTRNAVLQPAIRLARQPDSVIADRHLHEASLDLTTTGPPIVEGRFATICRTFTRNGEPIAIGDVVDRREIVRPLQAIAEHGVAGFCEGEIADRIVAEIRSAGGPLSHEDLRNYRVRTLEPLSGDFWGYRILTMPPPSSGGAVILQVLNILASADRSVLVREARSGGGVYQHWLVESMKHAFADRAQLLGDYSTEVMADVRRMISPEYGRSVWNEIRRSSASSPNAVRTLPEDGGTSHFCVVDRDGMAVACTESINLKFGSRIMVPGTGIILNNTMDDFSVDTEMPNAFGLRQSERNLIRPGARALSSMSPTIVLKNGQVRLVVGASGGPRIISSTLQTLLHNLVADKTVDRAIREPRIHHQWRPDCIYVQPCLRESTLRTFLDHGHALRYYPFSAGHVQAIQQLDSGKWRGACDPAKGGRPAGR